MHEWSALCLLRHCHAPEMVRTMMQVWSGTVADTRAQQLVLSARKRAWTPSVKKAWVATGTVPGRAAGTTCMEGRG